MENTIIMLREAGVAVDSIVKRLGGSQYTYLMICKKFMEDANFQMFNKSLMECDYSSAKIQIHTLKGIAANLGFITMEALCVTVQQDLKHNDTESLSKNVTELTKEYYKIITILGNRDQG